MNTKNTTRAARIALTLSLLAIGMTGCTQKQSPQALFSEAVNYDLKGDRKAAIIQLKNALQLSPQFMEARQMLASLYVKTGDGASAEKEIRKAIDSGYAVDKAWPVLAKSLLMQGQFQRVIDEAPPGNSRDSDSLALRGDAYSALGKADLALAAYNEALRGNESNVVALLGRARLHASKNDLAAASVDTEKAIAASGKNVEPLLLRANLYRAELKPDDAMNAYSRAIELEPGHAEALLGRAYLYQSLGKFTESQSDIDKARKATPGALGVFQAQASLDYLQSKPKQALESLQQVLRVAPDYPPAMLLAGLVQAQLGADQQAEDYLKRYLDIMPGNAYAAKQLAAIYLKQGDPQRASAVLDSSLKLAPQDAQMLALAGQASLQGKSFTKASSYFEKAAALSPDTARYQTALGVSRLASGDSQGAAEVLEKAAEMDKNSVEAALLLINSKIQAKQYDAALASIKKTQAQHPSNPAFDNLAGHVYLQKKDLKSARASFEQALVIKPTFFQSAAALAQLDVKDGKQDAARQRFLNLLEKEKDNLPSMLALSELATMQGNQSEALEWLEKANKLHPKDPRTATLLAARYQQAGKSEKAMTFAKAYALENPESPEALASLARIQLAQNDREGALDSMSKEAKLSKTPANVYLQMATMHLAAKDNAKAQEAVDKALSAAPDLVQARFMDGELKLLKGDHQAALASAKKLQQDYPRSRWGFLLEADAAQSLKDSGKAINALETAFKAEPIGAVLISLHRVMDAAGRSQEADAKANEWLKAHPNDVPVRLRLAEAHLMRKQYKAAIAHYEQLVKADGNNVMALNNLANAYQSEKDPRALEIAEKAAKIASEHPAILDTLGWILVERGDSQRGLAALRKAASLAPSSPEIAAHLEQAQKRFGGSADTAGGLKSVSASGS
jgi:putative PEP-CTERM system TPR-repeat lipoprotein